jgi:hypothetical protein
MPVPAGVDRCVFYGHLPGGEIFNWSLWINSASADQATAQAWATQLANLWKGINNTPGVSDLPWTKVLQPSAGYDGVRVYAYTIGNAPAAHMADAALSAPGNASSGTPLPNVVACAVTLKTATAGRSYTGRVYLPATNQVLDSNGLMSTSTVDGLASSMQHLIQAINGAPGGYAVCVVSGKTGAKTPVTSVRIDNKCDVQRRRENHQGAGYSKSLTI